MSPRTAVQPALTTATFDVFNPADDSLVGRAPEETVAALSGKIKAASDGFARWRWIAPTERAARLRAWSAALRLQRDAIARLITAEQGKPITESLGEFDYGIGFIDWFAALAEQGVGELLTLHLPGSDGYIRHVPIGVAGLITPWNFPFAMIARKAAAALAAGCTAVVKPSPETPLTALAMAAAARDAGIPDDVLVVVTGSDPALGETLVADPLVGVVSFTGSTAVGRSILANGANQIKRVLLELGGHAPFIVTADADIDRAVADAVAAKFTTGGQDCLAVNRFLVAREVHDAFVARFVARVATLRVGGGLQPDTDIGPLTTPAQARHCRAQIADAVRNGAKVAWDATPVPAGAQWLSPTVLTDVTDMMAIAREETFGPVAAITAFDTIDTAIATANASPYGLAAYVHAAGSDDRARIARRLDYSMVAVNTARMTGPPVPFGGMRLSGLGREGARDGLTAFTETQYICVHRGEEI